MGARGRRRRPLRDVRSCTIATIGEFSGGGTGTAVAMLAGLSSLLHLGFHVGFFPNDGNRPPDGDFAACTFQIFGWTADENGERAQLAVAAITGATPVPAPNGWAGRTELDQLELRLVADGFGTAGEWRAIAVLEPADPSMCEEVFQALLAEVSLSPTIKVRLDGVP